MRRSPETLGSEFRKPTSSTIQSYQSLDLLLANSRDNQTLMGWQRNYQFLGSLVKTILVTVEGVITPVVRGVERISMIGSHHCHHEVSDKVPVGGEVSCEGNPSLANFQSLGPS